MTGKTHMICSTAAVAVFALGHSEGVVINGTLVYPWLSVASAAVGAYLPDMDIQQSRLGQQFKLLSKNMKHRGITHTLLVPVCLLACMVGMHSRAACAVVSLIVGILTGMLFDTKGSCKRGSAVKKTMAFIKNKKGLTTTMAMLVLTYLFPSTGASLIFGLFAGWTLHIFEDLFNKKGCPILWPVAKGHIHIATFKTRHWSEYLFLFLWLGGCCIWAFLILVG